MWKKLIQQLEWVIWSNSRIQHFTHAILLMKLGWYWCHQYFFCFASFVFKFLWVYNNYVHLPLPVYRPTIWRQWRQSNPQQISVWHQMSASAASSHAQWIGCSCPISTNATKLMLTHGEQQTIAVGGRVATHTLMLPHSCQNSHKPCWSSPITSQTKWAR